MLVNYKSGRTTSVPGIFRSDFSGFCGGGDVSQMKFQLNQGGDFTQQRPKLRKSSFITASIIPGGHFLTCGDIVLAAEAHQVQKPWIGKKQYFAI